ncbi:MAG: MOSC domain-containing protein [Hyphomicrobiales bacterium]|nr:MOSC domain-containing protein [Hyphomicrobiales bacterium]
MGVAGDGHFGATVQHRHARRKDPTQPNLRQVHLLQQESLDALAARFGALGPGDLGENILTQGIDLLALPAATRLHIGAGAIVELTGLRNPCVLIDRFRPGLMAACLDRDATGAIVRKAGVMAIVVQGADIAPGDSVVAEPPSGPARPLAPV